eukprot:gnl/MRDRNA2_/MRDRNA2_19973_c0_seq1.p1 gnl/MRDRNA2_/MRDRNA2_19973_c0~~gnl/MRDRNA2_/MRDRNA2_19973_c0_seq1.p1  ORF type:complete len:164 (-),score=24.08 gnl/MRDRNA2_/MRDRNA2_19973_c0_seq1:97-588(-)
MTAPVHELDKVIVELVDAQAAFPRFDKNYYQANIRVAGVQRCLDRFPLKHPEVLIRPLQEAAPASSGIVPASSGFTRVDKKYYQANFSMAGIQTIHDQFRFKRPQARKEEAKPEITANVAQNILPQVQWVTGVGTVTTVSFRTRHVQECLKTNKNINGSNHRS